MGYRYVVNFEQSATGDTGNYEDFYERLRGNFSDQVEANPVLIKTGHGGNFFFHSRQELTGDQRSNIDRIGGTIAGGPFQDNTL